MLVNVVPIRHIKNLPVFQAEIDCLLPRPDPLLHLLLLRIRPDRARTLDMSWCAPPVPPVRLDALALLELVYQRVVEYHVVVHFAARVPAVHPADVPGLDAEADLVSQRALLGLVGVELLADVQGYAHVRPVDGKETVVAAVLLLPVLK